MAKDKKINVQNESSNDNVFVEVVSRKEKKLRNKNVIKEEVIVSEEKIEEPIVVNEKTTINEKIVINEESKKEETQEEVVASQEEKLEIKEEVATSEDSENEEIKIEIQEAVIPEKELKKRKASHYDELFLDEKDLKKYRIKTTISNILMYTFLTLVALFVIIPFYWMFATAMRSVDELSAPTLSFFPQTWEVGNFFKIFKEISIVDKTGSTVKIGTNYFGRFFLNTITVAVLTTSFAMVTTILSAFAFARLNFKGKETIFSLMLATMMIPGEIYVITNYMTVSTFSKETFMGGIMQWAGTVSGAWNNPNNDPDKFNLYHYGSLVLPFIVSVFYTFFLRQTFMQIPNELYLAAKVDGTGDFKYLWKVMIPMAKATITSILILSMMGTWNAYIWPNMVIRTREAKLVSDGLLSSFTNENASYANFRMAAAAMVTVPLLIVFICLKKYIMRGVSRSGIKG